MRCHVYVDGFNLYYGALKDTPHKWLDLSALASKLLPDDEIRRIRYFTARVSSRPYDPSAPTRQGFYLRALKTIPNLTIHFGRFLSNKVPMPLARRGRALFGSKKPKYVEVVKTEEKGSDVNLATYLLLDAFDNKYESAVVISNDTDLLEPIRAVRHRFKKLVGLLYPTLDPSSVLVRNVDFVKQIRPGLLKICQFPPELRDRAGLFRIPEEWRGETDH